MMSPHISTRIKLALNTILRPVGLELSTTLEKQIEAARINKLKSKGHWRIARYDQGLLLNESQWLEFLNDVCLPFQSDYNSFPIKADGREDEFYLDNGWFKSVDAEVLYCMLRHHQPRRVIEVGSGFSTRVMRRAIKDGLLETKITSIDPHPNTEVPSYTDEYIKLPVEEVSLSNFVDELSANDILFIDSSHTINTGGDIPYLFLEVLPRLKPGVFIHVHDIFLPSDYPERWVVEEWGWTEQYLVHAFLCYNHAFEILWPACYMWQHHEAVVRSAIPTSLPDSSPSSLWMKKIG